ncbi:MAG: hypothetical protein ABIR06_21895 [Cyclobacteriaceae bacterium]
MKLFKGLALLSFSLLIFGSCFDPPEFPVVPQIEFERVEFIDSPDPSVVDSLNIYIHFKDGDGDLGLGDGDVSTPYNDVFFYQENNGTVQPLTITSGSVGQYEIDLLEIPDPAKGKLVFDRTRNKPGYGFLPALDDLCPDYERLGGAVDSKDPADAIGRRLLIRKTDRIVLDTLVKIVDSLVDENKDEYYQIQDMLYFTPNQNHYNIEVDFLVKDPSAPGGFREFDWREEFCTTFDGRFPVFSDKLSSIEGTLRYSMTSLGFTSLFSIKTLKLRITIKDRALNSSNTIETPEFTVI